MPARKEINYWFELSRTDSRRKRLPEEPDRFISQLLSWEAASLSPHLCSPYINSCGRLCIQSVCLSAALSSCLQGEIWRAQATFSLLRRKILTHRLVYENSASESAKNLIFLTCDIRVHLHQDSQCMMLY